MRPREPPVLPEDPFAPALALRAPEPLAAFNRAGVLSAADVHVAVELTRLADLDAAGPAEHGAVALAVAFAVRAPRLGHVFVDLTTVSTTAAVETEEAVDLAGLPWPSPDGWAGAVAGCTGLVASGEVDGPEVRPLRLVGRRLSLDRYWREERLVATLLTRLAGTATRAVPIDELAATLVRLFPREEDDLQRVAAAAAVLRGLSVIAGGPGTGKTTTVARIAALLAETAAAAARPFPLLALCAPTGKAAARLEEAVCQEAAELPVGAAVREWLQTLRASTIHRLLGWRPGSHSRFRHDAGNRLPHDVVIVDETSMVSLSLMARLLESVRGDAQLVLVGDPDQLTAIEAGAVLRDIVGPAAAGPRLSPRMRALMQRVAAVEVPPVLEAPGSAFGDGVVVLERGRRFGAEIAAVAAAIRRGDGDGTVAAVVAAPEALTWIQVDVDADEDLEPALAALRDGTVRAGSEVALAAEAGDAAGALRALSAFRLLCAHRRGPYGVAAWTAQIERWLAEAVTGFDATATEYAGRPLLITENDYELGLVNGDSGVVVRGGGEGRLTAVFERDRELIHFAPSRLESAETLHAMTIHKSQGSQFEAAAVLLPNSNSRILTRELLYTAVTRARRRLILVGSEESLRAAVERPVARATGLRERLWEA
jgi:exodeoxyribonuclease V alpha subunit